MKRSLIEDLKNWLNRKDRKPLILRGARQVGKTYLLNEFGKIYFKKFHYLNFEQDRTLSKVFNQDLDPIRILKDLSFILNTTIESNDLIILDEIQECPSALTSLKYFAEQTPLQPICAAGSLLGLNLNSGSFPVGKVQFLDLYPMSFEEWLDAMSESRILDILESFKTTNIIPEVAHSICFEEWKKYLCVGGLPQSVLTYREHKNDIFKAMGAVRRQQKELIDSYLADVAKHSGSVNAMHIQRVWENIPNQLAKNQDGSSSKFVFKGVVPGIKGYERLVGAIDWLESAGLIFKLPIVNSALLPFSAYQKENTFKLYLFDVGILGALSNLPPQVLMQYEYGSYKGYFAENYVLQSFIASGFSSIVSWKENESEIEFLREFLGNVVPIEVKSGNITRAKSMYIYKEKYNPKSSIIFSGKNSINNDNSATLKFPIYTASKLSIS